MFGRPSDSNTSQLAQRKVQTLNHVLWRMKGRRWEVIWYRFGPRVKWTVAVWMCRVMRQPTKQPIYQIHYKYNHHHNHYHYRINWFQSLFIIKNYSLLFKLFLFLFHSFTATATATEPAESESESLNNFLFNIFENFFWVYSSHYLISDCYLCTTTDWFDSSCCSAAAAVAAVSPSPL